MTVLPVRGRRNLGNQVKPWLLSSLSAALRWAPAIGTHDDYDIAFAGQGGA
jgi:hypothetical protein